MVDTAFLRIDRAQDEDLHVEVVVFGLFPETADGKHMSW